MGKLRVTHSPILQNSPSSIRNVCSGSSPDSGVKVEDPFNGGGLPLLSGKILSIVLSLAMWLSCVNCREH